MIKVVGDYIRKSYDENGNVEITVSIKNYNDKKKIDQLQKDTYSFEIKKPKSKRSLRQNRYFWKLCNMVAEELCQDVMEAYVNILEETNCKFEHVMGLESIEDELKKNFRAVKVVRPEYFNGKRMIVYKCFIGSSKYDVAEMNMLINKAKEYCRNLDIEVEDEYY